MSLGYWSCHLGYWSVIGYQQQEKYASTQEKQAERAGRSYLDNTPASAILFQARSNSLHLEDRKTCRGRNTMSPMSKGV